MANRARNRFELSGPVQRAAPEAPEEEALPPARAGEDELAVAINRYRVTIQDGMEQTLLDRIFRLVPISSREIRQSRCNGFCRHL